MWLCAARAPPSVRPAFQSTTGLRAAVARNASKKARPSRAPSTYMATTLVAGSSPRYRRKSAAWRSSWLPTETALLTGRPRSRLPLESIAISEPLCEMIAVSPTSVGIPGEGASPTAGAYTPMQLGPIRRTPPARLAASSSSARASPSGVCSSSKPETNMITAGTPARPQSSITPAAAPGGVTTMARSIGWPIAETLG